MYLSLSDAFELTFRFQAIKHARDIGDSDAFTPRKWSKTDNHDVLLNVVFCFEHKTLSDRQDGSLCETLVQHVAAFVAQLDPAPSNFGQRCAPADPVVDDRIVPDSEVIRK